jgi:hypothetical protein
MRFERDLRGMSHGCKTHTALKCTAPAQPWQCGTKTPWRVTPVVGSETVSHSRWRQRGEANEATNQHLLRLPVRYFDYCTLGQGKIMDVVPFSFR